MQGLARAKLAVTTNGQGPEELVQAARACADSLGLPYVHRLPKSPLRPLLERAADAFLVFSRAGLTLWDAEGPLRFERGLAHLRIRRIDSGAPDDLLLRVGALGPGDSVLDCTLGLAQDARVAARAVGPTGRVVGIEKSLPLFAIVREGLKAEPEDPRSCRVEAVHADASSFLEGLGPESFDIVLIDPMFERPGKARPSFEALRRFADFSPLTPAWVARARLVARRAVLVKGSDASALRQKLEGIPAEVLQFSRVAWARIPPAP